MKVVLHRDGPIELVATKDTKIVLAPGPNDVPDAKWASINDHGVTAWYIGQGVIEIVGGQEAVGKQSHDHTPGERAAVPAPHQPPEPTPSPARVATTKKKGRRRRR